MVAPAPDVVAAHAHASSHRQAILDSCLCGCFFCLEVFAPTRIEEWVDDLDRDEGTTALCPCCGIDAVLGDRSGYPITRDFLEAMRRHWFG